ncbi:hypothetical protein TPHA_0H02690 [Tetrapisispora phaffii CBS 4417]|uniref:Nucleoside transporter FUN26 n=1 Tax=Tetrapisispora phaffii (strain ATCC 24235 / CBS 4417 / NBRC 1672 / NRRL Y-8282 / UCD 70-5) TaxID=1071381 RepID=G8BWM1_TETPH|nr:hypothetical protein TPHA_0H02690 [Tetrapisispora phaffii CBS 4417]CCE64472.1 hypothetical protein TPHA_0H02690 [Tetrapisispora phaffii CBS 4417]
MNDYEINLAILPFHKRIQNPVYLTFIFVGIGLLWPWNTILSASDYYKHDIFHDTTIWAKIFTSSMMTVSTVTSLLFNIWLTERQFGYAKRVVNGLVWEIVVFILIILIAIIHSNFPLGLNFFALLMLVMISSTGTALTQNGILAIANHRGSDMTQAVMLGQAIAGVLPSLVLFLISLFKDPESKSSSNINFYLFTTVIISWICIWLFKSNKLEDSLNYATDPQPNGEYQELREIENEVLEKYQIPFSVLYEKLKYLVLSIFTTFTITMVFAVFASNTSAQGLPLSDNQFIPLAFSIWNIGDLCGRFIAELPYFSKSSFTPYKTLIYSLLRIGLIPMFLPFILPADNFKIITDLLYLSLQFMFGLTNGHIISMCFIKIPQNLENSAAKQAAGGFANTFVATGLTTGSILSFVFVYIINQLKTSSD